MVSLSQNAKNRFDEYLREVRDSLRDCVTVDRDEVERNVIEHIENELADAPQPISSNDLESVLARLGDPRQWVPEEQVPWWRKMILRLRSGPEDWRLAYISFVLLLVAALFWVYGGYAAHWVNSGALILMATSFIAARAALSAANHRKLHWQKWLVYPVLIVIYVPLLCMLLLWPLLLVHSPNLGIKNNTILNNHSLAFYSTNTRYQGISAILMLMVIIGAWWTALGIIGCAALRLFKVIFRPFAANLKRRWPALLLLIGILLMLSCLAAWLLSTPQASYLMHSSFPHRRLNP